jgi:hypothetical protein
MTKCAACTALQIANRQFYGARLIHGVDAAARPSLLPGLPNIVFLDVKGQEQYARGTPPPGGALVLPAHVQRHARRHASRPSVGGRSTRLRPGWPRPRTLRLRTGIRSASNPQEASAVVQVLVRLVHAGVALDRVGVITFYRAQVGIECWAKVGGGRVITVCLAQVGSVDILLLGYWWG